MSCLLRCWVMVLLVVSLWDVAASERITRFHADIKLAADGTITVTEDIAVQAKGVEIRRGIYRDFPTRYPGPWLTEKQVGFEVLEVFRNGQEEPFFLEPRHNGMRLYIGSGDQLLPLGPHTYTLVYQTNQQLGYFAGYDEFYWNVTGNGWVFPIEQASAHIHLPNDGVSQVIDQQAWTGYQGESGRQVERSNSDQYLGFVTTEALAPYQGLTIGVQVAKGVFAAAPFDLMAFLSANLVWLLAVLVILAYLGFYLAAWYRHGRDPEAGVIMARFKPPKGLSPAAVNYIDNAGADDRTLTTAILSLATKGFLQITRLHKQYRLKKTEPASQAELSTGERMVRNRLFAGKRQEQVLSRQYNSYLATAKAQLQATLKREYHSRCFVDNGGYVLGAWLISLVAFFLVTVLTFSATMSAVDVLVTMIGFVVLTLIALASWTAAPVVVSLLMLGMLLGGFDDLLVFVKGHTAWLLFTLLLFVLNLLFGLLMRAPTPFGRHLKDEIDGLKIYLKAAEQHRLDALNPPDRSITHYEALLPYAVALGLEHRWAEQFADLLSQQSIEPSQQPVWYSHQSDQSPMFDVSKLTQSLNRNMRSATVRPVSSSSGSSASAISSSRSSASSGSYSSGSGGSSGGGGGGGGGGGW